MLARAVAIVAFALSLPAAAAAETVDFGTYHALIIGNVGYQHLSNLKTARNDAVAVERLLNERYGFETRLLLDATRADIITALSELRADLTEDDNLLIYYAGHGHLDPESGAGYWLPVDAKGNSPANWVSNSDITRQLKAIIARHVLVVADSCYAGTLTREAEAGLKTAEDRAVWLQKMAEHSSRTALTSGGLEPVQDAGGGAHSVFARAFLEALRENAEVLDGQSLYDRIKAPILANADQTPEYQKIREAGDWGGDFLFVPKGASLTVAAPAKSAPAPEQERADLEKLFWESIKDSDEPSAYEAYLEQFPNGTFAALARLKIEHLEAEPAPPAETRVAKASPAPQTRTRGKVFNVVPMTDKRGREMTFLNDIIRARLADMPNAVVVDLPARSKNYHILVSGRVSGYQKREEANPEYQGAQMAKQIFGQLGVQIPTQGMAERVAIYEAEVTLEARDRDTGALELEKGVATLKTDAKTRENDAIGNVLKAATQDAVDRLVVKLSGGVPPPRPVARQPERPDPVVERGVYK